MNIFLLCGVLTGKNIKNHVELTLKYVDLKNSLKIHFLDTKPLFVPAYALLSWQHFHWRFKDYMKNCNFFLLRQVEDSYFWGAIFP